MKKVFAIVLCLALVLSLGACAKKDDKAKQQEVLEYLNHFDGVTAEVIQ